jgi:hypothetical protein
MVELYAFQALRTLIKLKWVWFSYQVISVLVFYIYYLFFLQFDRSVGQTKQTLFTMGLVLLVYVPKMVLTLVLLGEDIFRMGLGQ